MMVEAIDKEMFKSTFFDLWRYLEDPDTQNVSHFVKDGEDVLEVSPHEVNSHDCHEDVVGNEVEAQVDLRQDEA